MQKRWNIIIVPNTSESGYNFNVSTRGLRTAAIAVSVFLFASITLCAVLAHSWKKDKIKSINNLREEIEARESDFAMLSKEFAGLLVLEEKLRTIAGLKPRQRDEAQIGAGGQGGPEPSDTDLYPDNQRLLPYISPQNEDMSSDALLRAISATYESFTEILEAFENEQDRLCSIPSINPVNSPDAWISSGFGYRKDPINGQRRFHDGADIVAPRKTPIIAPADGVVTFAGWRDGLGRAIEIRHGYGYRTVYGHNEKLLARKGDRVKRGDPIAKLGSSGRSTGPHLHYEIRLNGKLTNPYRYVIE